MDGSAWTGGDCSIHVVRSGAWNLEPQYVRSAFRVRFTTVGRDFNLGFRVGRNAYYALNTSLTV